LEELFDKRALAQRIAQVTGGEPEDFLVLIQEHFHQTVRKKEEEEEREYNEDDKIEFFFGDYEEILKKHVSQMVDDFDEKKVEMVFDTIMEMRKERERNRWVGAVGGL